MHTLRKFRRNCLNCVCVCKSHYLYQITIFNINVKMERNGRCLRATRVCSTTGARFLLPLNIVPNRLIAELNATRCLLGINFASLNFRQNGFCTFQKTFLHILARLCTRLQKYQIILLSKIAGFQECHLALLFEIFLVAN
jgi:hypothetical protein